MKKIAGLIGKVAPTVAALVGGPIGVSLGVVGKLATALGVDENASEEEFAKAIANAPPEAIAEIKRIESETKIRLEELKLKPAELAVESTINAREMAVKTDVKYQFKIFCALTVLVTLIVAAMFTVAFMELTIREGIMSLLSMVLGAVMKMWTDSGHFFNGSSLGSKLKDVK